MTITMNNKRPQNIAEIKQITKATETLTFKATSKKEAYAWMKEILISTLYKTLTKSDKGIVRRYLEKMTGYSVSHVDRLVRSFLATGQLTLKQYRRHSFHRRYSDKDIALLAHVDKIHGNLAGPATVKILKDEAELFKRSAYSNLANISSSHIYVLRAKHVYRAVHHNYQKTKPTPRAIGKRVKPQPNNQPGYQRVDSVHTGDSKNGEDGVYFINLVDEVTQWEIVLCVERISERYLKAALAGALALLPFKVINFHADNGSEYINHWVADLLNKIQVGFTKSRSRKSNDNALVESKNGHVIRKHFGHGHIPRSAALQVHAYCIRWLNPYLNFHRPCGFPKEVMVSKYGKIKKRYPHDGYMTPYEKLKSLPDAEQYLKKDISFELLDTQAYTESHTEFAEKMNHAKAKLFENIYS